MYYATATVVVVWLGFYLWYMISFNHFVAIRKTIDQAWAHIDVELQRRYDLIANLVQVVKGYAKHEADTLVQTVRTRSQQTAGMNVGQANQVTHDDAKLLSSILILVERYPELKADQQFKTLQQNLVDTENRIAERRSAYNACVNRYETYRESFPALIIAWAGKFGEAEFFAAQDETEKAVKVMLT